MGLTGCIHFPDAGSRRLIVYLLIAYISQGYRLQPVPWL